MSERKRLTDILHLNSDRERLEKAWRDTQAAEDFAPLPPGEYVFRVLSGELFIARTGTPGYKLTLEVAEGEHEGRRVWHDLWLTPAAVAMTKRDLGKIGITDLEQLERPLPPGILIRGRLVIRRDDDGREGNRLTRYECIGTEPGDAFEPTPDASDQADAAAAGTDFPFGGAAPCSEAAPGDNGKAPAGTGGIGGGIRR